MKRKNAGKPALVIALGSPADAPSSLHSGSAGAGKLNGGPPAHAPGPVQAESDAADVDTVPLDALAMPDDQEQMQPPEVGDVVNYQVTGKVVAIEGNMAKVERQSINGQDLPDVQQETNGDNDNPQNANQDEDGDEAAGLRQQAAGIGMFS